MMSDEEYKNEQDDYLSEKKKVLRNYQIKLLEHARRQNTIIFLPPGSGKTLIAIHVLCSRVNDISRPFSEGGKRAFFVSHTKVMVYQMAEVLKSHTKFKIASFTGDMQPDFWNRSKWVSLFHKFHVLVMTGEILKMIFHLNTIKPEQISLVVFDECHHAVSDHPFRLVAQWLTNVNPSEAPLITGLSAVLLNSNVKKGQMSSLVHSLETSFKAKIVTGTEFDEVWRFSSNPKEEIVFYETSSNHFLVEKILLMQERIVSTVSDFNLSNQEFEVPAGAQSYILKNRTKRIKKAFLQCERILKELGAFSGSLCALLYIIQFEKYRLLSVDPLEIQAFIYGRTELNKIRRFLLKCMGEDETLDSIFNFSSNKVQHLIKVIKKVYTSNNDKHVSTLIFVQERTTAILIAFLLKRLSEVSEDFSFLRPEFIVGSSVFAKESFFLECSNRDIVNRFSARLLNVLVATNVLEEGVDVPDCNVVINFDFPKSYPSYFQSRGRARDENSTYFVFINKNEEEKRKTELQSFENTNAELYKVLSKDSDFDSESEENFKDESIEDVEKLIITGKSASICVDGITANTVVSRYCSKLPQDKFTFLLPNAWYINLPDRSKKAFVQLPSNCPLKEIIEGEAKKNSKLAKRSAFLNTVKRLFELGELNEDLNPKVFEVKEEDFKSLFPHFKNENIDKKLPQPGTNKRRQTYKIKYADALSGSLPSAGVKAYLHVMNFIVDFGKPQLERKIPIYEALRNPVTFAILSSKKLCKILKFPLFLDMGQINCDLLVNYDELTLTEPEIMDIKQCHLTLFKNVVRVFKNSQVFDNRNKELSFFVVPVEMNAEDHFVLKWDLIRSDFCKNNVSALVRYNPSSKKKLKRSFEDMLSEEMSNSQSSVSSTQQDFFQDNEEKEPAFTMTEADYKYFVITPNYRNQDPPQFYIVNRICYELSPLHAFPNSEYENYAAYYKNKYMLEVTNPYQPLLKVSPIYHCSNFDRPRRRKSGRACERYKENDELLIPELCDVYSFDRRFWLKALLLPTALNRICQIYCLEEFRRKIVVETGLGLYEPPEGTHWNPLEPNETYSDDSKEETVGSFTPLATQNSELPLSKLKDQTQANDKDILDPERYLYEVGLCDLEFYVSHLQQTNDVESENALQFQENVNDEVIGLTSTRNLPLNPGLKILEASTNLLGPDLALLLEASTCKSSNDIINYERLEILGDSFLKFAVALFLFKNYTFNEGILTSLKGKIVGNQNLMYCGLAKNLQDIIKVTDFVPLSDWSAPLLCIPETFVDAIITDRVDPAVIFRLDIPLHEQFSGDLSETTLLKNEEILQTYEKWSEMPSNLLLPYKTIKDKTISDCVEAFIGAYLWTLGLPAAFDFILWLNILPTPEGSYSELIGKPYKVESFIEVSSSDELVMNLLNEVFYSDLEDTLNYHFENKALLLEAITHPSYSRNRVTEYYQRLEFLGDAVLDFLITSYIYERCGNLNPGRVTDIRSSLVNNITFACLTVRHELHKHLLYFSTALDTAIRKFVSFQVKRNHMVDDNVLILLEENDCSIGETIQVPKALSDLFESLAGAIYLDSGNSLEAVWKVYYALMNREIDEFTKNVPKTPMRLIHEICGDKPYFEVKVINNCTVKVSCLIYYEQHEIEAHGFGRNKKEGKISAVKLALNKILELKKPLKKHVLDNLTIKNFQ